MNRRMFDIHMHLIPGVDDGALDEKMALLMLLRGYDQGIRGVFATPHSIAFQWDAQEVVKRYESLRRLAQRYIPELQLYLGSEVYCERSGMNTVLKALDSGQFPTMNGTKYVLAEFSQQVDAQTALDCTNTLLNSGWLPIIAHVERYGRLSQEVIGMLKRQGCLFQINAYSVFDEHDETIKGRARELVEAGQVDFLGSDAHRTYHRPPNVQTGLTYLYKNYRRSYIDRIVWENARNLLAPCCPMVWKTSGPGPV